MRCYHKRASIEFPPSKPNDNYYPDFFTNNLIRKDEEDAIGPCRRQSRESSVLFALDHDVPAESPSFFTLSDQLIKVD